MLALLAFALAGLGRLIVVRGRVTLQTNLALLSAIVIPRAYGAFGGFVAIACLVPYAKQNLTLLGLCVHLA